MTLFCFVDLTLSTMHLCMHNLHVRCPTHIPPAWVRIPAPLLTSTFCPGGAQATREEFEKVDLEIPTAFAQASKSAGCVRHISLLGSVGADPTAKPSRLTGTTAGGGLYLGVKGKVRAGCCCGCRRWWWWFSCLLSLVFVTEDFPDHGSRSHALVQRVLSTCCFLAAAMLLLPRAFLVSLPWCRF